jgi:iron(III) transport system substrate-binding protein
MLKKKTDCAIQVAHWSASLGALLLAILAMTGVAAAADLPAPGDTAALYANAKMEGGFVWYDSGPLAPMQSVAADFEKAYPGVKATLTRIVGVAQYQRFVQETEAKQYIVDLVNITDEPSVADLIDRGDIAEWKVPTYDRFPDAAHLGASAYAPYRIDVDIAYNPKKVTPEEVKILASDWKGILDPRFKGRIAVTDQKCGTCYAGIHMFLDPKYKDRYGAPFLKAVAEMKPTVYSDVVIPVDRVTAGEQDIYFMAAEGVNINKWADGAPLAWVHPSPTPLFASSWYQVSKYAPHPNSVRLFLNWLTSEDGAKSIQAKYGGLTTISGVPDNRAVAKQDWYMPITDPYTPDWKRWSSDYDKDMGLWSKLLRDNK